MSVYDSEDDAKQVNEFRPMLDLAGKSLALGAVFSRPIPDFRVLWQWGDTTSSPPALPAQTAN